jgi:tetratricopeptide (TPR) repeat protein
MLAQAVSIADTIGAVEPALEARSWLAWAHLQLGDAAAALAVTTVERELTFPPEEPAMHMFHGLALLELDRLDESVQALTEALAAADGLLALADRNVAALGARALALSCLAVVTSDQARAAEAAEAFARARAVTRAPGVVADTRRLLGIITAHHQAGLLTATGCGSGW